jgi:hypothetical protein
MRNKDAKGVIFQNGALGILSFSCGASKSISIEISMIYVACRQMRSLEAEGRVSRVSLFKMIPLIPFLFAARWLANAAVHA